MKNSDLIIIVAGLTSAESGFASNKNNSTDDFYLQS